MKAIDAWWQSDAIGDTFETEFGEGGWKIIGVKTMEDALTQ